MSNVIRKFVIIISGLTLVAGCGGGGSSNGQPDPVGGGTSGDLATITSQNAARISGVVVQQSLDSGIINVIDVTGSPLVSSGTGADVIFAKVARIPMPQEMLSASGALTPCDISGIVDIDIDIADPFTLTSGDTFRLEFSSCDDGSGSVSNGVIIMTVTAFEGDLVSGQYHIGMSLELQAFQVTQNGETTGATTTISIDIDTTMPPITTISVSTAVMVTTTDGLVETMTNVSISVSEDESMFPTSVSVETGFRISSPRIGGDVVVRTLIAMQSTGDEYPFFGELEIRAAGNSVIVIIALGGNMVRLEIDINGDGAVDEVVDMTWDELIAAAEAA